MSRGVTLDTRGLIAFESGNRRMAALVEQAQDSDSPIAIPAGVLAQAWRGGARQARIARLLRASSTDLVALDQRAALKVGVGCAASGTSDVVDASVVVCARDREHAVVTTDPADLHAIDPNLTLLTA